MKLTLTTEQIAEIKKHAPKHTTHFTVDSYIGVWYHQEKPVNNVGFECWRARKDVEGIKGIPLHIDNWRELCFEVSDK